MTTLADHIDDFVADVSRRRDWRPNTQRAYRNDLLKMVPRLVMPVATITEAQLDLVLQDAGVAVATRCTRAVLPLQPLHAPEHRQYRPRNYHHQS